MGEGSASRKQGNTCAGCPPCEVSVGLIGDLSRRCGERPLRPLRGVSGTVLVLALASVALLARRRIAVDNADTLLLTFAGPPRGPASILPGCSSIGWRRLVIGTGSRTILRAQSEEDSRALAAETRLLREQTALLIEEIRAIRGVLADGAQDEAPAPTPRAAAPPSMQPSVMTPSPQPPQRTPAPAPPPFAQPAPAPVWPAQPAPAPPFVPQWLADAAAATTQSSPMPAPASSPLGPFPVSPVPAPSGTPAGFTSPRTAPSTTPQMQGRTMVKVVSAGYSTGNVADFFLNDKQVPVVGLAGRRGLNVVTMDPKAGQVLWARSYDIWGSPLEESKRVADDLNALADEAVVLVALKDSGMENIDSNALAALRNCGCSLEGRLAERESYALVGIKGDDALAEKSGKSMIMVEAVLPFASSAESAASVASPRPTPSPSTNTPWATPPSAPASAPTSRSWMGTAPTVQAATPATSWATRPAPAAAPAPAAWTAPPTAPAAAPAPAAWTAPPARTPQEGHSWEEVVLMLEDLEETIRAKRVSAQQR